MMYQRVVVLTLAEVRLYRAIRCMPPQRLQHRESACADGIYEIRKSAPKATNASSVWAEKNLKFELGKYID